MPRQDISMSQIEVVEFLRNQRWVVLGTLDSDGGPWADVAASLIYEDRLYFRVPLGTRSYANIRRDNRVCCVADRYPSYYEIKGVMVHGKATHVTDRGVVKRTNLALKNISDPVEDRRLRSGLYCLPLDDVSSFDFTRIRSKN